ncbi:GNAT family N-acetyltransferase [Camelimonas abortus]|uniref:GNAT family N-acetyltransferase n=1 Tax=Camelimonas abortus TaxID=1017184 RepID=A0ABV7LCC3_9HYPH
MRELVVSIRRARPDDAVALTRVHDASWREAYQGILPGVTLERLISRRGPRWWSEFAIRSRREGARRMLVLDVGEEVGGYVIYGANRNPSLPYQGEIDAIYLAPVFHGLGLGRKLFRAARNDLASRKLRGAVVWCLDANERGRSFYASMGGTPLTRSALHVGGVAYDSTAYAFS